MDLQCSFIRLVGRKFPASIESLKKFRSVSTALLGVLSKVLLNKIHLLGSLLLTIETH